MEKTLRKLVAFTLAETLVVIGIIGIVSALTLPNLNKSTGEKEKIAHVKKLYADLTEAYDRATIVYGPENQWIMGVSSREEQSRITGDRITEFMKVSKKCGMDRSKGCFANKDTVYLNGVKDHNMVTTTHPFYEVILADGSSLAIDPTEYGHVFFVIDIDGPNKGPNTYGVDIFDIKDNFSGNDYLKYAPASFDDYFNSTKGLLDGEYNLVWVLAYDNMDYLKLDKNGKCKSGKTMTEQSPTCN